MSFVFGELQYYDHSLLISLNILFNFNKFTVLDAMYKSNASKQTELIISINEK